MKRYLVGLMLVMRITMKHGLKQGIRMFRALNNDNKTLRLMKIESRHSARDWYDVRD